jgi:exodeoxyribonuclease V beta subunit
LLREFSFPAVALDPKKLRRIFSRHGAPALPEDFLAAMERLDFKPVEGYLRGFIDLLFHFDGRYFLADWKSNWLGNRPADYDAEGIARGMARHSYHLQYLLYTVAADLYLRRRVLDYDYEKNFGGVFYLFMRGVDPHSPGRGIFYDKPDAALVRELRETFTGGAS